MSFYRLDLPIKGFLSPENRELFDWELSRYARQIQYMMHDIERTEETRDNGRIFCVFPDGETKGKIMCADLSVYEKGGELYASMEIETTIPETSSGKLAVYFYKRLFKRSII